MPLASLKAAPWKAVAPTLRHFTDMLSCLNVSWTLNIAQKVMTTEMR